MLKWMHLLLMTAVCVVPLSVLANPTEGVNWKSGMISAQGMGVPPERAKYKAQQNALACRAAIVDAYRNLLETTKGVRVDSQTLVKDAVVESDLIRTAVKGIVKGARIIQKHLLDDGSCEVTAVMPLAGKLFSAVISEDKFRQETSNSQSLTLSNHMKQLMKRMTEIGLITTAHASPVPILTLENPNQLELAKKLQAILNAEGDQLGSGLLKQAIQSYTQVRDFTGIIIDASLVPDFTPAALPWIRGHSGIKIYPNAETPYEVVRANMPVAYDFNVDDALKNKRVTTHPLIIRAVSTYKSKSSDLMLDKASEKMFMQLLQKGYVNNKARIMIVVSP